MFAAVFATLVFVGIFRLARSSTRTLVILGPLIFCTERCVFSSACFYNKTHGRYYFLRVVTWSLRAKQAKTPSEELDKNLTIYWQVTFAAAYMTIWGCLVKILRCLLVATTRGNGPVQHTAPLVFKDEDGSEQVSVPYDSENYSYTSDYVLPMEADRPNQRFWYRRVLGALVFAAWIPVITGTILGYNYVNAETDQKKANTVQSLSSVTVSHFSRAAVL